MFIERGDKCSVAGTWHGAAGRVRLRRSHPVLIRADAARFRIGFGRRHAGTPIEQLCSSTK